MKLGFEQREDLAPHPPQKLQECMVVLVVNFGEAHHWVAIKNPSLF
jgi:hypothetical protein